MDARRIVWFCAIVFSMVSSSQAQFPSRAAVCQTENFRIFAADPRFAQEVAQAAEQQRKDLAAHWLGHELPRWNEPCPIHVHAGPNKLASGETKYTLMGGGVHRFQMVVSGTNERIVDSVLPHEITHTILATHFAPTGKPVPRWADEGACTTVEHTSERSKHDAMLVQFLGQGRGIPFATLFSLRDYPADMMPLYAQGYSLTSFLIAQKSPKDFIRFLELGMSNDDWVSALSEIYDYPKIGKLQTAWNRWVSDGGGPVEAYTAVSMGVAVNALAASNVRDVPSGSRDVRTVPVSNTRVASTSPTLSTISNNEARDPSTNNSVDTSGSSYYIDRLKQVQQRQGGDSQGADGRPVPYRVSQPAPFQTLGGTIYR